MNDNKGEDKDKSKNVIKLIAKEDKPHKISSQERKDDVVSYLLELAAKIDEGELPADRAVLLFYEMDEDEDGFSFSPRTVGIYNSEAVTLCELAKEIFIREMLG